jgi:hypothetical protein
VAAHCLVLQSKQFRNPAVKIGRVICFHVNKVNMDNKVLKFRAVRAPALNNSCRGSNDAHDPRAAAASRAGSFPLEAATAFAVA